MHDAKSQPLSPARLRCMGHSDIKRRLRPKWSSISQRQTNKERTLRQLKLAAKCQSETEDRRQAGSKAARCQSQSETNKESEDRRQQDAQGKAPKLAIACNDTYRVSDRFSDDSNNWMLFQMLTMVYGRDLVSTI